MTKPKPRFLQLENISKGYLVYLKNCSVVTKLTNLSTNKVIGRFILSFLDYCPINRQYATFTSSVSISIICSKLLTIWWGDGTIDEVIGPGQMKMKNYGDSATRTIIIYGPIKSILGITVTGAIEIGPIAEEETPSTIKADSTLITADSTGLTADKQ